MKQVNEVLFRAIVLCFSALLLVLTLLCSIRLTAARDGAARLERQCTALEEENALLRTQYENSCSLAEIERYATQILGMQHCDPGQVFYMEIEMPED